LTVARGRDLGPGDQLEFGAEVEALGLRAMVVETLVSLHRQLPSYRSLSGCRDAYQYVKNYPGDRILSENVGAMVLAGKTPGVLEPFLWSRLVVQGGWSGAEMLEMIRARHFDLMLRMVDIPAAFDPEFSRWPNPVIEAIEKNYSPTELCLQRCRVGL
jgi:hypothetical protein